MATRILLKRFMLEGDPRVAELFRKMSNFAQSKLGKLRRECESLEPDLERVNRIIAPTRLTVVKSETAYRLSNFVPEESPVETAQPQHDPFQFFCREVKKTGNPFTPYFETLDDIQKTDVAIIMANEHPAAFIRNFERYGITDEALKEDLAKLCTERSSGAQEFPKHVEKLGLTDEKVRALLAVRCFSVLPTSARYYRFREFLGIFNVSREAFKKAEDDVLWRRTSA